MIQSKISVIVPVYKAEAYLRKCLDSLVNQSYHNLEILLVDDGSPDCCGAICDEYAAVDPRIVVIHKDNGGVSHARNAGLERATGEWIGWVDSDDWVEQDLFEYLLTLAQTHGADVVQCGAFLEEGAVSKPVYAPPEERNLADDVSGWRFCSNNIWNKLYAAHLLRDVRFAEEVPIGEDLLFNLQVFQRSRNVVLGTQVKYHYLQHPASICHRAPDLRELLSARQVYEYALTLFEREPEIRKRFWEELFRNDLDICSKIVRFYQPEFESARTMIRRDIRRNLGALLRTEGFSEQERMKFVLIAFAWSVYRVLLLASKNLPQG